MFNFSEDETDSLDEFIQFSQANRQDTGNDDDDSEDIDEDDSFQDMISQVDETEYMNDVVPSPKSKVNKWLDNSKPQSIDKENVENFKVAARKEKKQQINPFKAQNHPIAGPSSFRSPFEQINSLDRERQKYMFQLLSREQDMHQQKLDLFKDMSKKKKGNLWNKGSAKFQKSLFLKIF